LLEDFITKPDLFQYELLFAPDSVKTLWSAAIYRRFCSGDSPPETLCLGMILDIGAEWVHPTLSISK